MSNGGTERINHTMAQMFARVMNERLDDWDVIFHVWNVNTTILLVLLMIYTSTKFIWGAYQVFR